VIAFNEIERNLEQHRKRSVTGDLCDAELARLREDPSGRAAARLQTATFDC